MLRDCVAMHDASSNPQDTIMTQAEMEAELNLLRQRVLLQRWRETHKNHLRLYAVISMGLATLIIAIGALIFLFVNALSASELLLTGIPLMLLAAALAEPDLNFPLLTR